MAFLDEAHRQGYTACADPVGFGVEAANGRQGLLTHRGKGRYWVVPLGQDERQVRSLYVDRSNAP